MSNNVNGTNSSRVSTTPGIHRIGTTIVPTPKGDDDDAPVGLIIGCAIGGIALFVVLAICICLYRKHKQSTFDRRPSPIHGRRNLSHNYVVDTELENGTFNPGLDASVQGLF